MTGSAKSGRPRQACPGLRLPPSGLRPQWHRERLRFILVAQALETLLDVVHLALEVVDLARAAATRSALVRLLRLALAPGKRREHGEGALEHLHVPPHLVLERA